MRLKDKIAIVTGGSQGIGEAICYAYAKEGATVVVVNKNNPMAGQQVANKIKSEGGFAEAIVCDVADEKSVNSLVQSILAKYKKIDILVNNAAVLIIKEFENHSLEDWDQIIDVNLKGPFLLSKAVLPAMKSQRYGKIINMSSVAASIGFGKVAAYSASKAGLLALTKTMVSEYAKFNINVNSISPGNTETPMNQKFRNDSDFVALLAQTTPTGRAYMKTSDIAGAAVFLASDEANAIFGLDLLVDDGYAAFKT